MTDIFDTEITYLKGVGPKRAEILFKELGVATYADLLNNFPYRYIDKSRIYKVSEITNDNTWFQLRGTVSKIEAVGAKRIMRISAQFRDDTGSIELVWFKGLSWIKSRFEPGKVYTIFGKPTVFKNHYNFVHPEIEDYDPTQEEVVGQRLEGIYRTSERLKNNGMGTRGLSKLIRRLLNQTVDRIPETLPSYLLQHYHLIDRKAALLNIHFPQNPDIISRAELRLKFEELLLVQLQMLQQKHLLKTKVKGYVFAKVGDYLNTFYAEHLPFTLTNAQKRVIKEIRKDIGSGMQMNRLLQGDVGSGKTLVALMSMLIALDNDCQACIMAPTEILATQHLQSVAKLLGDMDVEIALLTGSTKKAQRKHMHERLQEGKLQILIGTHALLEDEVVFKRLGLVVIDEQHRFGVAQRARLWQKSDIPPHILVMTATPIPRTLAMTVYGNLDVSVIDELPPGRKPIKTLHFFDTKRLRVTGFIREQIKAGRQVYIVYPLISDSEKSDLKNLMDGFEQIQRDFPSPEYLVSVLHGRMKTEDKEYEMQRFVAGKTDIMVSTTVIEVGLDVPNASVMVIENAERFGLSQLHQLRGRVGRGADQSYCVLMSSFKLSEDGRKRLEIMVQTNDGFEISEADLKLRGPGDMAGTKQSGLLDLKIANLAKDGDLIMKTRNLAVRILDKDPDLASPNHQLLKRQLQNIQQGHQQWGRIS